MSYTDRLNERFWAKVDTTEDCWLWTGNREHYGYGRFQIWGHWVGAHRMAYTLTYGRIPDGLCVLHHCDNRRCVNPEHLWLGSKTDNQLDMSRKGRSTIGERNRHAKLTAEQVLAIRRQHKEGTGIPTLRRQYGVGNTQMTRIVRGERWKHILEED